MKLKTWDKPSFSCLASRLRYGQKITIRSLKQIEKAEEYLKKLGFKSLRVRKHYDIARIELEKRQIKKIFRDAIMDKIAYKFKRLGFLYVTVDIEGFRSGSMNVVCLGRHKLWKKK